MPISTSDGDSLNGVSLLSRDYQDRQLIVVLPSRDDANPPIQTRQRLPRLARGSIKVARKINPITYLFSVRLKASVRKTKQDEGLNILPVTRNEAEVLTFPIGHPRNKVVYVGHPAIPNIYYPAALFHRLTFEHKFSEAIRLLTSLGATQLEVERLSGWSREFIGKVGIPGTVGAEAGRTESATSHILFTATLRGTKSPKIPESLVWYDHEQLWQDVADLRLNQDLQKFSLDVQYEDDYGINAGLKLAVEKYGLDFGGQFTQHQATVWRIIGVFGEPT